MAVPQTPDEALEQVVFGPKKSKIGTEEFENFAPKEIAEGASILAGREAAKRAHFGLRFTKLVPPRGGS